MKKNLFVIFILFTLFFANSCLKLSLYSPQKKSVLLSIEGEKLLHKGDYELALIKFNEAIKIFPKNEHAYNNRGLVYKRTGNFDKAASDYDKAISLNPKIILFYINKASLCSAYNKQKEAISLCNKALSIDHNSYSAYANRGYANFYLAQYDEAEKDFQKLCELNPNYYFGYTGKGIIYYHKDKFKESLKELKKAEQMGDSTPFTLLYIGKCYEAMNDTRNALNYFRQALEAEKRYPDWKFYPTSQNYRKEITDKIRKLTDKSKS